VKGQVVIVTGTTVGGIGAHTAMLLAGRAGVSLALFVSFHYKDNILVYFLSFTHPPPPPQPPSPQTTGAHVVCAGRTMSKLEECDKYIKNQFPDAKLTLMQLDVSSFESVRSFVSSFNEKFPENKFNLGVLVNNGTSSISKYYSKCHNSSTPLNIS
jgi:NAD(P)-dependent dehydrogenase (short-subunit alcohol dehydrogenase family)